MFFPDPSGALREMARAIKDDGTVAIQVWDRLEDQPAYRPFIDAAARSAGPDATDLLEFLLLAGRSLRVARTLASGGLWPTAIQTLATDLRFGSVDAFVMTEVQSTPLGERLTATSWRRSSRTRARRSGCSPSPDGALAIPIRGHVITATLRARGFGLTQGCSGPIRASCRAGRGVSRDRAGPRGTPASPGSRSHRRRRAWRTTRGTGP